VEEPDSKTLGIDEVTDRLGLGRAEVYRRVKDGELPAEKADRAIRFREGAVAEFQAKRAEAQAGLREELGRWLGILGERLLKAGEAELPDLEGTSDDDLVAELMRRVLSCAALENADDVHVDPVRSGDRLLFRFEGDLKEVGRLDGALSRLLKEKLKALVGPPAEGAGPGAEGDFSHAAGETNCPMHLCSMPTAMGEHVHVHLLAGDPAPSLDELGYTAQQASALHGVLTGRPGLFLVAGAAGALAERHRLAVATELAATGRLVVSLEHRAHPRSELLVQLEVGGQETEAFDPTFRKALGMSPDILLLDEVRDAAEAQALLEAAWAGTLVVAEMRAAGAAEALLHLLTLAPSREVFARTLLGAVERVALRRLCPHCRVAVESADGAARPARTYVSGTCEVCGDGFLGRRAVYGVWIADAELADLLRRPDLPAEALFAWDGGNPLSLRAAATEAVAAGDVALEDAETLLTQPRTGP